MTGFAEHALAGNLRPAGKLLANYEDEEDFSLKKLRRSQYFGSKFGYRRQFALISDYLRDAFRWQFSETVVSQDGLQYLQSSDQPWPWS